jgi:hypothetical protein
MREQPHRSLPKSTQRSIHERPMDELNTLQSLGFTLPSPAYIFGAVIFGFAGMAAYRLGKVTERPRTKWLGVALMLYPYAISGVWLLYVIGVALCVGVYWDRR